MALCLSTLPLPVIASGKLPLQKRAKQRQRLYKFALTCVMHTTVSAPCISTLWLVTNSLYYHIRLLGPIRTAI